MEKEIENILDNVLQEAHRETQREIRAEKNREKKKSKIINTEFEVEPITDTPFTLVKGKKTLLTIGNEILMVLEQKKTDKKGVYIIQYDKKTKKTVFELNWNLIGPVMYKIATAAAEKVYNDLKNK